MLLERACAALADLVRQDYPDHKSLAEIAFLWGTNLSEEQVAALDWLEDHDPK